MIRFFSIFALLFLISAVEYFELERLIEEDNKVASLYLKTDPRTCLKKQYDLNDNTLVYESYHDSLKRKFSLATMPRLLATALLSKAALMLPDGDFVETGVYTGGTACIMMQILLAYDDCNRKAWFFDSFDGLPNRNKLDGDYGKQSPRGAYATSQNRFEDHLKKANAWNESVHRIVKGWFNETLSYAPIEKIAFLHLDGDLYDSTLEGLHSLYHKVIPGGYIYIDDYGSFEGCRNAVDLFRAQHHIYETMRFVRENTNSVARLNFEAVWWRKRFK